MIINTIKINNISSFKEEHVFHFNHSPQKTITLIFGENGAGKTSILQALKVGLYGQFLFGNSRDDYHSYLSSFIRRNESSSYVELHFSLRTMSGLEGYIIKRTWRRTGKNFKEALSILKGKEIFKEIAPQFFQEFIFSIIPIGMMELFFFDGEKINTLGKALSAGEISNAVRKLIGISAIEALEDAVRKSQLDDIQGVSGLESLHRAIIELEENLAKLHKEGEQLHQQYAEINEAIKKCKTLLAKKEIIFFETGGNLASSHNILKEKQKILQQRLEEAHSKILELSQDYLPLCILSDELNELSRQLLIERDDAVRLVINEYARKKNKQLKKALIEKGASDDIIRAALEVLTTPNGPVSEPIHGFSAKQSDEIFAIIRTVDSVIRPQALNAFALLETTRLEINAIESALEKSPDNTEFVETLSAMKDINVSLARHEKCLEDILTQKRRVEIDVNTLENKRDELLQQIDRQGAVLKSDKLVKLFPQVLKKIKADLYERRIQTLQSLILQNIRALFRKNQLIRDVRIESDFSIELFGKKSETIDLKCLSAGEQQMLATAIQWALAALASSHIPTIIDTPLARLDSHHRKSLVQSYYPAMSQLILLSTDREIDSLLLQDLEAKISDIYSLKYNKIEECTEVVKVNSESINCS